MCHGDVFRNIRCEVYKTERLKLMPRVGLCTKSGVSLRLRSASFLCIEPRCTGGAHSRNGLDRLAQDFSPNRASDSRPLPFGRLELAGHAWHRQQFPRCVQDCVQDLNAAGWAHWLDRRANQFHICFFDSAWMTQVDELGLPRLTSLTKEVLLKEAPTGTCKPTASNHYFHWSAQCMSNFICAHSYATARSGTSSSPNFAVASAALSCHCCTWKVASTARGRCLPRKSPFASSGSQVPEKRNNEGVRAVNILISPVVTAPAYRYFTHALYFT